MIERIVQLTLRPEELGGFIIFFNENKAKIEGFEGCNSVRLLGETNESGIVFTYSLWNEAADLEIYRNSDFFMKTWTYTKTLFADKAKAWSTKVLG